MTARHEDRAAASRSGASGEAGIGGDPDLDRLAEDWIAFGRRKSPAWRRDPDAAAVWRQAMAAGAAWLRPAPAWPTPDAAHEPAPRPAPAAAAPGAAGAAAGGGDGHAAPGDDPAALRARIDALEQRLAAIEAGRRNWRGSPRSSPPAATRLRRSPPRSGARSAGRMRRCSPASPPIAAIPGGAPAGSRRRSGPRAAPAARLRRQPRPGGAVRALPDQPRPCARPGCRGSPCCATSRQGVRAAAARLGRPGPAGTRLQPHRLHRRPA